MRLDRIRIEDYDPDWPLLFEEQRRSVTSVLANRLVMPIEHIGSTAVPGLPAKPIIDMLGVIGSYEAFGSTLPELSERGWLLAPEPGDESARKYSLCYPTIEFRTHHLHIVEPDWGWQDLLIYRDYLRAHPDVVAAYAALKRRLAATDDQDRPRYRAAKAPFIRETLVAARQWHVTASE